MSDRYNKSRPDSVSVGRGYEKLAEKFFHQKGFETLDRNWRAGSREIDLVVRNDDLVIFVEVKSAASGRFGHPAERVDKRKVDNLSIAARQYLTEHHFEGCDFRFDLITFSGGMLEHFPNAFESTDT